MATAKKRAKPQPKSKNPVADLRAGKQGSAKRSSRPLWENVKGILGAVVIFLFLRTFLIEAYRIPSGSMIPSLLIGDWLFVNKLVYGPHVPFTSWHLPGYQEPKRWEIAVFVSPPQHDQPEDLTPTLVKRIVGMPGDTLHMRDAKLFINGVPQADPYGAQSTPGDPDEVSPLYDWQHRIALQNTRFGTAPRQPTHDNWGPLLIPGGHYFMMGDNRYESKDSRYWGVVPRDNIRGRPMFVYYSWDSSSHRPLPFITAIRWGRIFHRIR